MSSQLKFDIRIIRGGASRGIFFLAADLPANPRQRDAAILAVFGSNDPRQIDGLAGADELTSKVAVVGPSQRTDADVDCLIGHVGIERLEIDWSGDDADILSAVGTYAVLEGLIAVTEPVTTVRAYQVTHDRVLRLEVPVADGEPAGAGEAGHAGIPGTARLLAEGSAYVPEKKFRHFLAQMQAQVTSPEEST
jgi:2-methylaconitate cis-trans-isomerase PrpF